MFHFLICILFIGTDSFSQARPNSFAEKRWKVREFYVNDASVRSGKIDSLRFFFSGNGMLRLGITAGTNRPSVPYRYNAKDSLITIEDRRFAELRYKVLFFDSRNLVMTQEVPGNQDKITRIEYRMVPDM